jgi:hypothetical protein
MRHVAKKYLSKTSSFGRKLTKDMACSLRFNKAATQRNAAQRSVT